MLFSLLGTLCSLCETLLGFVLMLSALLNLLFTHGGIGGRRYLTEIVEYYISKEWEGV